MRTSTRAVLATLLALGCALGAAERESLKKAVSLYENCDALTSRSVQIRGAALVDGRVGKALLLERRDGNRLADCGFSAPGDWLEIGRPVHLAAGVVRVTESDYLRQVALGLPVGEWCCLSVFARTDTPGSRLELRVGRDTAKEFPLTAERSRLVFPFRPAFMNDTVTLRARGPGAAALDSPQLETGKTYPSTFTTARLRPSGSMIKIPVGAGGVDPAAGAVALWVKPEWVREHSSGQVLFAWGDDAAPGADAVTLSAHPRGDTDDPDWPNRLLFLRRRDNGSSDGVRSFPLRELEPAAWHHVVASWNVLPDGRGRMALFLDGKPLGERTFPWGETKRANAAYVGYWWGGYADAAVDEIYIFNRPVTAEEAAALFRLETPL